MCGAAGIVFVIVAMNYGLSPRVRGSQVASVLLSRQSGSIPACAGQPLHAGRSICRIGVYPRVCGAASSSDFMSLRSWGLSPRVRGSHSSSPYAILHHGSIPACAGQPSLRHAPRVVPRVYPRVCGAAPRACGIGVALWGLSPRVRGSLKRLRDGVL